MNVQMKHLVMTPNHVQNYIHDGSGVYITRNRYNSSDTSGSNPNNTDYVGGFLFANNLSYGNGMNGVVVHIIMRVFLIILSMQMGKFPQLGILNLATVHMG